MILYTICRVHSEVQWKSIGKAEKWNSRMDANFLIFMRSVAIRGVILGRRGCRIVLLTR